MPQRTDLTYKFNNGLGRHGWLRLTPAYSVKLVNQILQQHQGKKVILDPFSGTGTTPLCSASHGHEALAIEVNPFLAWLGNAKLASYSTEEIDATRNAAAKIIRKVRNGKAKPVEPPAIFNITRWWDERILTDLCLLKGAIDQLTDKGSVENTLLNIAFCRTMLGSSNAAFNHQSMSFKDPAKLDKKLSDERDPIANFENDAAMILDSAQDNPTNTGLISLGDSRTVDKHVKQKVDLVITSPPYPNRMSYIRELRPYMYWMGYIKEAREAGELDWKAIGGTWGIATSRLNEWKKENHIYFPPVLEEVIEKIASSKKKNDQLLANYVAKYFADTWMHLQSLTRVLNRGAEVHYIVGNVTFYGHVVEVERIYAEMMLKCGFSSAKFVTIRKRNSNKQLYEFDVQGTY